MEGIARLLIESWGPLALGWIAAALLGWLVISERRKPNGTMKAYQDVIRDYHDAIVENTKMLERLAVLMEERTMRQNMEIRRRGRDVRED